VDNHGNELNAHAAYALASEAIQTMRSHEKMTALQFSVSEKQIINVALDVNNKHEELKTLISETCTKMEEGFKAYDNKFWSLAVALIFILLSCLGFLVIYTLFPGVRGH